MLISCVGKDKARSQFKSLVTSSAVARRRCQRARPRRRRRDRLRHETHRQSGCHRDRPRRRESYGRHQSRTPIHMCRRRVAHRNNRPRTCRCKRRKRECSHSHSYSSNLAGIALGRLLALWLAPIMQSRQPIMNFSCQGVHRLLRYVSNNNDRFTNSRVVVICRLSSLTFQNCSAPEPSADSVRESRLRSKRADLWLVSNRTAIRLM